MWSAIAAAVLGLAVILTTGCDRIADDVALPSGEHVDHAAPRRHQGDALGGRRGGVHEVQSLARSAPQPASSAPTTGSVPGLDDVAQRLLLDGGQAARDVALGRLGAEQVGAGALDHRDVVVIERLELAAHFVVDAALGEQVLAAGQLAGLAEDHRAAVVDPSVDQVGGDAARAQPGGGVGLTILRGEQDLGAIDRLADSSLASCRKPCRSRAPSMTRRSPLALDRQPWTGLPVFAMPSATAEVQFGSMPITSTAAMLGLAPTPISVRNVSSRSGPNCSRPNAWGRASRAGNEVGDPLGGSVGQVVDREDHHVVATADRSVVDGYPIKRCCSATVRSLRCGLDVLPANDLGAAMPIRSPYSMTSAPAARSTEGDLVTERHLVEHLDRKVTIGEAGAACGPR